MSKIIVELGINHLGDENLVERMVEETSKVADLWKVQIRTPEICVPKYMWNKKRWFGEKEVDYIDYKREMEKLDWEKLLPKGKWFASCWDIEALKRFVEMDNKQKIVKFPACFTFADWQIYHDFLKEIPEDYEIFFSIPFYELGEEKTEQLLYYMFSNLKHKKVPFLTFMGYNNKPMERFDVKIVEKFLAITRKYFFEVGYSSHSGTAFDIITLLNVFDYIEFHYAVGSIRTSDTNISLHRGDIVQLELFLDFLRNSKYTQVDDEKLKSLIPEQWKKEENVNVC